MANHIDLKIILVLKKIVHNYILLFVHFYLIFYKELIEDLAEKLTNKYGKGFTKTSIYYFLEFYRSYPDIFHTVCGKSLLSWTHFRSNFWGSLHKGNCSRLSIDMFK